MVGGGLVAVYGFRRWRVCAVTGLLRPLVRRPALESVWVPGQTVASCAAYVSLWSGTSHQAPGGECRCGLYAWRLPLADCRCPEPTTAEHGAVGVVRLGGRVLHHTAGYRAQYGQVVALVDYTGAVNGCYPAARYPDTATMWAEWAPGATERSRDGRAYWCAEPVRRIAAQARRASAAVNSLGDGFDAFTSAWVAPDASDTPAELTWSRLAKGVSPC